MGNLPRIGDGGSGMAKTEKTFLLYFPIFRYLVYLHILLFIPEQALSISGRSLFFLWDVHQIDTLSRIMLNYQSKDSRPNKASHIPDLISNEGSTVISAMMYAPDTIHPTA